MIKKVDIEKAVEIYANKIEKDFLEDEIPPLFVFERCIKEGIFECFTFDANIDEIEYKEVGYIVTRKIKDIIFIMVLAIDKDIRGNGLGKLMLNEFKSFVKDKFNIIILEVENPEGNGIDSEEKNAREKRIKFYKNLDFKIVENLKYLLVKIDYKILYLCLNDSEKILDAKQVIDIMEAVYKNVLRNRDWLEMEVIN